MHYGIIGQPFLCRFYVVCSLLSISHRKNLILGGSGRVYIFVECGLGFEGY
jgi:hypothetical protein